MSVAGLYCLLPVALPVTGPIDCCRVVLPVTGPIDCCRVVLPVTGPIDCCRVVLPVTGPIDCCRVVLPVTCCTARCRLSCFPGTTFHQVGSRSRGCSRSGWHSPRVPHTSTL